ncbi:MAG: hypothetical protein ABI847_08830, partial [Anaerolineales bacterium]
FTLPQFYRFRKGAWKRAAPPADWTAAATRHGLYADITYLNADADFIDSDLGPYLDDLLQRACDNWGCTPGGRISVQFGDSPSLVIAQDQSGLPRDEPLLFAFIRSADLFEPGGHVRLAAPHSAGYPADAASAAWMKRAIGVQVLAAEAAGQVAARSEGGSPTPSRNAFLYAVVARAAAQLGLEPPETLSVVKAGTALGPDPAGLARNINLMADMYMVDDQGLTVLGQQDVLGRQIVGNVPADRDKVLRGALAITNWLVRGQPDATDNQLIQALPPDGNQIAWLTNAFHIDPDEAWTRLQLAAWQVNRPADTPELALFCSVGTALASLGGAPPTYFLANYNQGFSPSSASVPAYSPDGQWFSTANTTGPIAINLDSGRLVHLPLAASNETQIVSGWISETVLDYVVRAEVSHTLASSLHFSDVADPQHSLPVLPGIRAYSLSPDRSLALVALDPPTPDGTSTVRLAIMPAWGPVSAAITIGQAQESPRAESVWSPDGRQIAYSNYNAELGAFTLRIADAASGQSHEILNAGEFDQSDDVPALVAWSPAGDELAVGLQSFESRIDGQFWLGVVNADGTGLNTLLKQPGFINRLGFSADGLYLAAAEYDSGQQSVQDGQTVIYELPSGRLVDTLEHTWSFAWSPTGHQLAVIGSSGVDLLTNIANREGENVTTDTCSEVQWSPRLERDPKGFKNP